LGGRAGIQFYFSHLLRRYLRTQIVLTMLAPIPQVGDAARANSRWVVLRAVLTALTSITKEMLDSEEPWAMAITFTLSRPSALKVRPAIPGVPRMFSPTTATIAIFESTVMCSTL